MSGESGGREEGGGGGETRRGGREGVRVSMSGESGRRGREMSANL